ncbi:FYVE zinc finger-domain-containing protein, partial [Gloeopeniophorella convolvens]
DVGRIEQTRFERRLEKLINLHFGEGADKKATAPRPKQIKRMSSIFELDIRNMGAGDLWRGVIQSQVSPGSKADIRAAEQNITPWQNDADVSQCPLCSTSFHPITNRKHHCRLCGKIICSLPVKHPQRPAMCSLLFVADPQTGQIEEVGEGVDYGVRRRTLSSGGQANASPDEKFLRGVRICRDCRPVLLRQQYAQDRTRLPTFSKLYDVFINLEKEIEDALPLFQELLLTLSSDDRPTAEASAARKRLLDAFAQYDALAKRIRKLPTSGPGSSQDRVLAAVQTRASVFLQKHMFPLQSLPKPSKSSSSSSSQSTPTESPVIDPQSELAHALQPLLEQEALLESFVEEAKAHRKFEDAKTLKVNLHEIRAEIDRLVANA